MRLWQVCQFTNMLRLFESFAGTLSLLFSRASRRSWICCNACRLFCCSRRFCCSSRWWCARWCDACHSRWQCNRLRLKPQRLLTPKIIFCLLQTLIPRSCKPCLMSPFLDSSYNRNRQCDEKDDQKGDNNRNRCVVSFILFRFFRNCFCTCSCSGGSSCGCSGSFSCGRPIR